MVFQTSEMPFHSYNYWLTFMLEILVIHCLLAIIILAYVAHSPHRNFSSYILTTISGILLASSFGPIDNQTHSYGWLNIMLIGIFLFIVFLFLFKKIPDKLN